MSRHARVLLLGCSTVAIGIALAVFAATEKSPEWLLFGLACCVVALGVVTVVIALINRARSTEQAQRPSIGVLARSYLAEARNSRKARLLGVLSLLWFAYNAVAFAASVARQEWGLALLYGVLAAVIPVMAVATRPTP